MMRGLAAVALLGVVIGGAAAADPHARAGKVVRVERVAAGGGNIRFCSVNASEHKMQTYCFGPSVAIGEKIVAMTSDRKGIVLAVTRVQPYTGMCEPTEIWIVEAEVLVDTADVVARGDTGMYIGLIGGGLDPHRSILDMSIPGVSHAPDGNNAIGIDRDGDGHDDVAFEQHACNARGDPTSDGPLLCYEVWVASTPNAWTRKRVDFLKTQQPCN